VGSDAEVVQGRSDPGRAEEVDFDGAVEGRVEGDGGGRVEHDVARRQHRPVGLVEAEAVGADVAGDHLQAPGHELVEGLGPADLGPEAVEGVVADDLALDALGRRRPPAGPHEQDDLAAGDRAQQALDDGGAEESGGARDGDPLADQGLGDHAHLFTMW
jgi:hypothetical protein